LAVDLPLVIAGDALISFDATFCVALFLGELTTDIVNFPFIYDFCFCCSLDKTPDTPFEDINWRAAYANVREGWNPFWYDDCGRMICENARICGITRIYTGYKRGVIDAATYNYTVACMYSDICCFTFNMLHALKTEISSNKAFWNNQIAPYRKFDLNVRASLNVFLLSCSCSLL